MRRGAVFVALAMFTGVLAVGAPKTQALLGTKLGAQNLLNALACQEAVRLCTDADLQEMQRLESKIADNFFDGQVYEIEYGTPAREPGDVKQAHAFADSALWTGTYLGSQSFRYALAKKKLALPLLLTTEEKTFWETQKAQASTRIKDMLRKFHILINISKYWNHELELTTEPVGFGGGIISGEPGYLMRACNTREAIDANPTSGVDPGEDPTKPDYSGWSTAELDPTERGLPSPYTSKRRVFGPFRWPNPDSPTEYFCEDGTSRDAYAGTIFGLLVAFDLYSGDDAVLRQQIRDDVVTLSNFAFKYLWNHPRPHGVISIPIDANHDSATCSQINQLLDICGHDFENFISPLFTITPTAQMEMTQAAYHVVTKAPGHPDTTKWQLLWNTELAAMTPYMAISHQLDTTQPYDSYYKWNLEHLIAYNLIRQAPNVVGQTVFKQAFSVMDASTNNDVNAHFEAISYTITGEQKRLVEAITHLRQWRDYRARIELGGETNNTGICHTPDRCVPQGQRDVTLLPGAKPIIIQGGDQSERRAHFPLPVASRTPTDFLWQRAPNQLVGFETATHQAPGIDYLLPYWMIRYHTEASVPLLSPYPFWPVSVN